MPNRILALQVSLYATLAGVFVLSVLPADVQLPDVFAISDVLNHGLAFLVISLLADLSYPALGVPAKVGAITVYGGAIEISQYFVPTRECSLGDVAVDLAATLLFFAASRAAAHLISGRRAAMRSGGLRCAVFLLAAAFLGLGCSTSRTQTAAEPAAASPAGPGLEGGKKGEIAISEFILGVGDQISVEVYRNDDLNRSITVGLDGKVMFPLIGDLQLAGRSVFSLRDEVKEKLAKYLIKPEVTITVTSIKSRKTLVLGEVKSPGYFLLDTELSVLDLVSKAGGATDDADLENVRVIWKGNERMMETKIDLKRLLAGGDRATDRAMQNGDIVVVPTKGIASAARYLGYVTDLLRPFVLLESGIVLAPLVRDVFTGGSESSTSVSVPAQ